MIAAILTVFTAIEVAIVYVEAIPSLVMVLALLGLMLVKFGLVIGYYMHLIPDNRYFTYIFLGGLIVAGAVVAALTVLFGVYGEIPGINHEMPTAGSE